MRKTIVQELRELGAKVCPQGTAITGETASEVIHCIATHFERGTSATKLSELENDTGFITEDDVPAIPDAPEEDGDYKLVIASGVASWGKITG